MRFPGFERTLPGGYASLSSERLDAALKAALPPGDLILGAEIAALSATQVTLADGQVLKAGGVIDARGPGDMSALDLGWQKFVGMSWIPTPPHALTCPIIMDARIDQADGYRFVYVLHFATSELFIEDTYYTQGPELDVERIKGRIAAYAGTRGWAGAPGERVEIGLLPVCMGGDIDLYWQANAPAVAKAGAARRLLPRHDRLFAARRSARGPCGQRHARSLRHGPARGAVRHGARTLARTGLLPAARDFACSAPPSRGALAHPRALLPA